MRITGGKARGIPLVVPRGDAVRPATDALRQALFSSIGARVEGARFLDLFAGSGAYGLEALSRGAAAGLFVERDRRTLACLEKNLAAVAKSFGQHAEGEMRVKTAAKILAADVVSPSWDAAATALAPALVFIDPPYERIEAIADPLFARLRTLLAPQTRAESPQPAALSSALVIFEAPGGLKLAPEGWHCLKRLGGKKPQQPSLLLFELAP
ncbi:hypothetical protein AXK12_04615 [Cephaloticoccus capnophilus]|uniref:Methyltransferase n=1 Tax=Cephaloticoccus capnophilus TaxID=1548208 RepID=A0A139SN54_9BACT|nr:RsmD family RNA methyltransferase [Cephaloticoccus capnophilus]KXU35969.1 hypothetical protein AXK12_04615 [Cephaloticoccus capnophilus]